jgi:hypothetical protein
MSRSNVLVLACVLFQFACGGTDSIEPANEGPNAATPNEGATGNSDEPGTEQTNEIEACPVMDGSQDSQLYDHVIRAATSSDGVSFQANTTTLLEHASVPDGVIGPDGKTWVYFVNGNPGQHAVFVAKRDENGLTTFDCIRIDGKVNGNAVDPDIIRLDDGRYRIVYFQGWFVGSERPKAGEMHPIYSAISTDGINFTEEGKLFEHENIYDPSVTQLADGSWLMSLNNGDRTLLTSSADGRSFQETGLEFDRGISELHAFDGGSTVRLYITGIEGLVIYKSTDAGLTWEKEGTAQVGGADPSLVAEPDGTYTLYVKAFSQEGQSGQPGQPNNPPKN